MSLISYRPGGGTSTVGSAKGGQIINNITQNITQFTSDLYTGNTLTVDAVYGNDVAAASDPYKTSFLTIQAALSAATSGQVVFVRPGAYQGPITIPTGVAIRGISTQVVSINALNVTSNTTCVTMGIQSRLEDITINVSSSSNVDLIGVDFPSGTPQTSKMRTMVVNVTSTATGLCSLLGIRSAGTSSTTQTSSNSIRASTVNVIANGTGVNRGILVSGPNRFSIRETNIYITGSGANNVGAETTHADAVFECKTSSISGVLHDINQTAGVISLGLTDLVNNNANGNGFAITTEPSHLLFVLGPTVEYTGQGSLVDTPAGTYYLTPGTSIANFASVVVGIPFPQRVIVFDGVVSSTIAIPVGVTVTVNIYKSSTPNVLGTSFKSAVLNSSTQNVIINNFASTFNTNEYFQARCVISGGSLTAGTNICIAIGLY